MTLLTQYPKAKPLNQARTALWKVYLGLSIVLVLFITLLQNLLPADSTIYLVLFRDQWVHRMSQSTTLLLWTAGVALLIQQWIKNQREYNVFMLAAWVKATLNQAWQRDLMTQVMQGLKEYQGFLSIQIWHRSLSAYIDQQLNYEQKLQIADREKDQCYDKIDLTYRSVNTIIWLIPLSGFLGTVIGMSLTMGRFDQLFDVKESNELMQLADLSPAVQGLATAFDTTLLALALVIPLKIFTVLMQRKDDLLIQEIDELLGAGFIHTRPLLDLTALTEQSSRIQQELSQITQSLVQLNKNLKQNQWVEYTQHQYQWQDQMLQSQIQALNHLEQMHQHAKAPLIIKRVDT
jgi:biopolymer transport protein ExbB/TolQ